MPHYPKPFRRKDRGLWYVQIDGKQYNLGRDREQAFKAYHELMNKPKPIESKTVAGILEGFLVWCYWNRKERTYNWYKDALRSFARSLPDPKLMRVSDLKPFHVVGWADSHRRTWSATTRRMAIIAVQRAFNWAERLGHIDKSPIRHIEKPEAGRREQVVTQQEYANLLKHTRDRQFRDVLEFAWETGARPQEIRAIEARHVNVERERVELPPQEAKGGKRWRIIYLTTKASAIVRRLMLKHPSGPIFRNADGNHWKKSAINCRFCRLQKKTGTKFALYAFRHTFATRLLEAGADALVVSTLLGHKDGAMLAKVYSHLGKSVDYLREELRRAIG